MKKMDTSIAGSLRASLATACCVLLIASSTICSAEIVQHTRLNISPPSSCKQNSNDNWIQCWSPKGAPLAQFNIIVGRAGTSQYKRYWTQDTLIDINSADVASTDFEPIVSFRDDVAQWANGSISNGGQITAPFEYGVMKNEQGVLMLYSMWNYTNANGVELMSGFYQVWDRGQAISIMSNLPMNLGQNTDISVQMVGETLKSIDLR